MVLLGGQLLAVAVPQKNGIVHGNRQLQHRRQGLGDVRDFTQEVVAAHIQENGHANGGQEHKRGQPGVQKKHHYQARTGHCQGHIGGLLPLAQVPQVRHHGRQARDEALLPRQGPDLRHRLHGLVCGSGRVEKYCHHGGISGIEHAVNFIRQHLLRDGQVQNAVIPQN